MEETLSTEDFMGAWLVWMGCRTFYFSFMSPSDTVPEDSISGLKPCEYQQRYAQTQHAYPGSRIHIPQCDDQGNFVPLQCHGSTGFCWCVDRNGHEVPGTQTPPGSTPPHCGPPPGEPPATKTSRMPTLAWSQGTEWL
jgi:hypothetical protein